MIRRKFFTGALISLSLFSVLSCKNKQEETTASRTIGISIVHDNDLAVSEWLSAGIENFKPILPQLYPDTNVEISLISESTAQSVENIANGKRKADAILLPHKVFSETINSNLKNLGARISSCKELIASPYIAVAPKNSEKILSSFLTTPVVENNLTIQKLSLKDLGKLFSRTQYAYAHPGRSARGQFSSLLSIAAFNSSKEEQQAAWDLSEESLKSMQQLLQWYSPSDSQLLKRITAQTASSSLSSNDNLVLGLVSLRQIKQRDEFTDQLIILEPSDKTIWEVHSLCISEADWVSPIKKSVIENFQKFLTSPEMLEVASEKGFENITEKTVLDPEQLEFSENKEELSTAFTEKSIKPLTLNLAIDTSASMRNENIANVRDFVERISNNKDKIKDLSVIKFSADVEVLSNWSSSNAETINKLSKLTAIGGSSIYDTLAKQFEMLNSVQTKDSRAVAFIITDGNDKNSRRSLEEITEFISKQQKSNKFVSLHIIAIATGEIDINALQKIADSAYGVLYQTDPDKLPELLIEIEKSL